ncbi:MAG: hypothetical protein WCH34_12610 [Bacteroidota bacterium]
MKEAVRFSKYDNDDNKYWNSHYKKIGYSSATEFYEGELASMTRLLNYRKESATDKDSKLEDIKRREKPS